MLLVDIVIPVYNKEEYISDLLDSLLTRKELYDKIILVDDCSKDRSVNIIREYEANHPDKIIVFQQEQNRGPHYARIKGAELSGKEFVMFSDADDLFHLDGLHDFLNSDIDWPRFTMCYGNTLQTYTHNSKDFKYISTEKVYTLKKPMDLLLYEMPPMIGLLVRKDIIPLMAVGECSWGEDIIFFVKAINAGSFAYKGQTVGLRRIMEGTRGTSGGTLDKRLSFIKLLYSELDFKKSFSSVAFFLQLTAKTLLAWCVKKIK